MPRPGRYLKRIAGVVIHDAVTSLPAPLAGAEANLPPEARRLESYAVRIEADGAQQISDPILWARAGGVVERVLGQPNAGALISVDQGRGAVFDVQGGDWEGLYLQGTLAGGAAVTVTVFPLVREG